MQSNLSQQIAFENLLNPRYSVGLQGKYKVKQVIVLTVTWPVMQQELRPFVGMSCYWARQLMIQALEEVQTKS